LYNRRKILLELINNFGGELNRTKFYKLLFLLSQKQENPSYNFVPYQYGCYSFLAEQDISVLKKYGYLENTNSVKLNTKSNSQKESVSVDDVSLNLIKNVKYEFGKLSNNEIINYVYNHYPFFALNSKIKDKYIPDSKIDEYKDDGKKVVYSIGYEGKDIDMYLNELVKHSIKLLCDVRKNPLSMKYGFSKNQLKVYCEKLGIEYLHLPEFGIESAKRKNLNDVEDYDNLFADYVKDSLPLRNKEIENLFSVITSYNKVAFTCFEADYKSCHRSHLLDYVFRNNNLDYSLSHL
jgi:uncharacterized protein (DUF488 family)